MAEVLLKTELKHKPESQALEKWAPLSQGRLPLARPPDTRCLCPLALAVGRFPTPQAERFLLHYRRKKFCLYKEEKTETSGASPLSVYPPC